MYYCLPLSTTHASQLPTTTPRPTKYTQLVVLVQVKDTTTTGVGEAVVETRAFDPTETKFPLGGVAVKGDVRVSVFNKLSDDFSAADEMAKVPNAMKAKGLILHFMFHTGFMDSSDDPDSESMFIRSEQHSMKVGLRVHI